MPLPDHNSKLSLRNCPLNDAEKSTLPNHFQSHAQHEIDVCSSSWAGPVLGWNEPARPAAARPVSHDAGGQAAGGCAVRTERPGQYRRKPTDVLGKMRRGNDENWFFELKGVALITI